VACATEPILFCKYESFTIYKEDLVLPLTTPLESNDRVARLLIAE
jgi:hypothetical protein